MVFPSIGKDFVGSDLVGTDGDIETVFEEFPIATWEIGNAGKMAFPVVNISEVGGNRIIRRERPYRDGEKLDDTGSRAKVWVLTAVFENTIDEKGLEINSDALYPTILDNIIDSFDNHETGDLVVPTRGKVRARAESYDRNDDAAQRDSAVVRFTFIQDNEDNVNAASFSAPTANANARRLGETTTFDAQFDEMWSQNLRNIERSSQKIESVATKPGEVSNDVEDSANVVESSAVTTERSFSKPGKVGRNKLLDPESSKTQRKLVMNRDLAARAKHESRKGRPKIITVVASKDQSLFSIAAFYEQDYMDLLAINPKIGNPNSIPRGTTINIYYVPA